MKHHRGGGALKNFARAGYKGFRGAAITAGQFAGAAAINPAWAAAALPVAAVGAIARALPSDPF